MAFWLLILLLIFFFPFLFWPFLLFLLLLIPLKLTMASLGTLLVAPGQLLRIARNPSLRKNHALEHATINVLEERFNYHQLAGYAEDEGFFIMGLQSPEQVEMAAREGLKRLKNGERELVIHDRCGTTITAANLASAVLFLLLLFLSGMFTLWTMLAAVVLANFVGPALGRFMQKNITTSAEVDEVEIIGAEIDRGGRGGFWQSGGGKIYVRTREIPYATVLR